MALRPVTFTNRSVTAKDHGTLFQSIYGDGRIRGSSISISGNVITIQAGYFLICGRLIELTANQTFTCENEDQFAQVVITINESGDVAMNVRYATTSTGFPALIQNNLNTSGTYYEAEVCVCHTIPGGTSVVNRVLPYLRHHIFVSTTEPTDWENGDLWFVRGT